jgi:hypothetical protein
MPISLVFIPDMVDLMFMKLMEAMHMQIFRVDSVM